MQDFLLFGVFILAFVGFVYMLIPKPTRSCCDSSRAKKPKIHKSKNDENLTC